MAAAVATVGKQVESIPPGDSLADTPATGDPPAAASGDALPVAEAPPATSEPATG